MLHQLQIHRQILYKLAANYLEPMSGTYERLFYLAGLRDATSGMYVHQVLISLYGELPVHEALAKAHEEIFEKLLEMPLAEQETDLRAYLQTREAAGHGDFRFSGDVTEGWIPKKSPSYLRDLFRSNLAALRQLLQGPPSTARSST